MDSLRLSVAGLLLGASLQAPLSAQNPNTPADLALQEYFRAETEHLAADTFAGIDSADEWKAVREERKRQLLDMLGLWPLPERSALKATVAGTLEGEDFSVEKIHFQSLPGLYVTANVYRPRRIERALPAILYACGHARVVTNGVSCGNKAGYQHHGIWFARHGYVCLLLDTLQLGEIEGDHHGTYRLGQWWWNSRGYTPAGVEAWNCMRAIDYLESRADVDRSRIGMTGRSGGGSYTWTTAAIDDRIRVAAPVAGMTDLENHVIDGVVEGHCDCMYFVNTHRWDFGLNAALIAPRPLLVVNTDSDSIFPLDGVQRIHWQLREVYGWYQAATNLGLVIAPGPHRDTQDLQVPVFRWFDRHLKGEEPLIRTAAERLINPVDLRALETLPSDQRNTTAQEWFGPRTRAGRLPELDIVLSGLRERVFHGWPEAAPALRLALVEDREEGGLRYRRWDFESQPHVPLRLELVHPQGTVPRAVVLRVLDQTAWERWLKKDAAERLERTGDSSAVAWLCPRGIGPGAWSGDARKQAHIRRRFMLLGQTLDGMRVWDIRRGLEAVRRLLPGLQRIELAADREMAANALFATLFEPDVAGVKTGQLAVSLRDGPDYLNVLQIIDVPEAVELARQRGVQIFNE
jgi:dienelactone hydrolase